MDWMRSHPFAVLFALAGLIVLGIAMVFQDRNILTQAGGTTPQNSGFPEPATSVQRPNTSPTLSGSPSPIPLPVETSRPPKPGENTGGSPQKVVTAPSSPIPTPAPPPPEQLPDTSVGDALLTEVYSLIPSSAVPFPSVKPQPTRTPSQQSLYIYGNEAGLAILSFENAHGNMGQDLKNWYDHRGDTSYQGPISAVASDMIATGKALQALPNVPTSASAANKRLAASLEEAGAKLQSVVAASGSDSSLAETMQTYDSAADEFTKSYVALADLFTLQEVTFSQSDTGSAFTFSANGAL